MSSSQFKLEGASGGSIRGKPLSYNPQKRSAPIQQFLTQQQPQQQPARAPAKGTIISLPLPQQSIANDSLNATRRSTSLTTTPSTMSRGILALGRGGEESAKRGVLRSANEHELMLNSGSTIPRTDLTLLSEDVPLDGIIFARSRMNPSTLIVFRTPEERSRNPERLNLDRRQLDVCPFLENETRLRLLNYQNNNITVIQNLENLPNLIFLDLYNNKITSLDGPLSSLKTLRVLMAGKNKITEISNLSNLKKLDVLDLHSNNITEIDGFATLQDLRVLNLAGNSISAVRNLHVLHSLTELNLRRNNINLVEGLDVIPTLQRIFLSHNNISVLDRITCIFNSKFLLELTLDGNPISEDGNSMYRVEIITRMPNLKHLDLKRITDEERLCAKSALTTYNLEIMTPAGLTHDVAPTEISVSAAETVERPSRPQISNSYYALARLGRLNPSNSVFEIEPYEAEEKLKSLVVAGDIWEFNGSKRLLQNVVDIVFIHISKDSIVRKMAPLLSSFTALKAIRLLENYLESLKELQVILELFPNIEQISISKNVVCSFSFISSFCSKICPNLKFFNDVELSTRERQLGTEILEASSNIMQVSRVYSRVIGRDSYTKFQSGRRVLAVQGSSTNAKHGKQQASDTSQAVSQELVNEILKSTIENRVLSREFHDIFSSCLSDIVFEGVRSISYQ